MSHRTPRRLPGRGRGRPRGAPGAGLEGDRTMRARRVVLLLMVTLAPLADAQAPPAAGPGGAQIDLSLAEALRRGLDANLAALTAAGQVDEAAGARRRARRVSPGAVGERREAGRRSTSPPTASPRTPFVEGSPWSGRSTSSTPAPTWTRRCSTPRRSGRAHAAARELAARRLSYRRRGTRSSRRSPISTCGRWPTPSAGRGGTRRGETAEAARRTASTGRRPGRGAASTCCAPR